VREREGRRMEKRVLSLCKYYLRLWWQSGGGEEGADWVVRQTLGMARYLGVSQEDLVRAVEEVCRAYEALLEKLKPTH